MKRPLVIGIVALSFVVVLAVAGMAGELLGGPEFDAERFKSASARGDLETLESEAHSAAEQHALRGLSPEQVRALLGGGSHIEESSRTWVWELGMINDYIGPGDDGAFRVQFDPSWKRVINARVE